MSQVNHCDGTCEWSEEVYHEGEALEISRLRVGTYPKTSVFYLESGSETPDRLVNIPDDCYAALVEKI